MKEDVPSEKPLLLFFICTLWAMFFLFIVNSFYAFDVNFLFQHKLNHNVVVRKLIQLLFDIGSRAPIVIYLIYISDTKLQFALNNRLARVCALLLILLVVLGDGLAYSTGTIVYAVFVGLFLWSTCRDTVVRVVTKINS